MSSIRGTSPFANNYENSLVTRPVTSLTGKFPPATTNPVSFLQGSVSQNLTAGLFGKIGGYFKRLTMAFLGRSGEQELTKSKEGMSGLDEQDASEYGDTDPLIGRWPDETKPIPNPFAVKREVSTETLGRGLEEQAVAFSPESVQSLGNERKEQQEALQLLAQQIAGGGGDSGEGGSGFAEI